MDFALILAIVAVLLVLFFGVRRLPHLVGSLVEAGREFGHDVATHRSHGTTASAAVAPPAAAAPAEEVPAPPKSPSS